MEQGSKKWILVVTAVAVVAALGWWMWQRAPQATAPGTAESTVSQDDTTAAIEQELNATDFGNLEAELKTTDADLNSL